MKILITGGGGFYGEFLNRTLSENNEILTLFHKNIGSSFLYNSLQSDITDLNNLDKIFNDFNPDVVLHTAAISNPLLCNKIKSSVVYDVNVNATKSISELCEQNKAKLIYTSTDLVYAGYRSSMLDENSKLIPSSLYAETKLMGEVKIKETFDNNIILRQALLFGLSKFNTNNHFQFMYNSLKDGNPVKVFTDQFRTPISVFESAKAIKNLIEKNVCEETINLGGNERVSRFELGEILCNAANFDKNLLQKISLEEILNYSTVKDVSLNTDKLNSFGIKVMGLEESIREVISNFN